MSKIKHFNNKVLYTKEYQIITFNLGFESESLNNKVDKCLIPNNHHPLIFDSTDKKEGLYSLQLAIKNKN